jgi:hypothetical protein
VICKLTPYCQRCNGAGEIRTWGGRAGEGGKRGPCPRCNPVPLRFILWLKQNPFLREDLCSK